MPIYEYACEKCGHEFEREQRITDHPVKTCPACRARRVRRLISRTAFVLKGGGWYSDLYSTPKPDVRDGPAADAKEGAAGDKEGAAGKQAAAESAAAGDSKSSSGGQSSSDAKPAAKSKGKPKKPRAAA